jgi:hypothetical protein
VGKPIERVIGVLSQAVHHRRLPSSEHEAPCRLP